MAPLEDKGLFCIADAENQIEKMNYSKNPNPIKEFIGGLSSICG